MFTSYYYHTNTNGNLVVTIERLGVSKEALAITPQEDNSLGLAFHYKQEPEQKYTRELRLGNSFTAEQAEASLEDGVLTLTIPQRKKPKIN